MAERENGLTIPTEDFFRLVAEVEGRYPVDYREGEEDKSYLTVEQVLELDQQRTGTGHKTIYNEMPIFLCVEQGMRFTRKGYYMATYRQSSLTAAYESLKFLRQERNVLKPNPVVLELGGGLGGLTYSLADRGFQVISVENDRLTFEALEYNFTRFPDIAGFSDIVSRIIFHYGSMEEFYEGKNMYERLRELGLDMTVDLVVLDPPWSGDTYRKFVGPYSWKDMAPYGREVIDNIIPQGVPVMVKVPYKLPSSEIVDYAKEQGYNRPVIYEHKFSEGERGIVEKVAFIY